MTRLRPVPLELLERFYKTMPKGCKPTPDEDLQLNNMPLPEEPEHTYPRWDLLLDYWNGEEE